MQIDWSFSDANTGAQGAGGAMLATGSTTVTIAQLNNAPVGTVTISGTPLEGEVLTAANTLVDNDGLGVITYQWQSSSNGSVWSAIGSGATFTLAQAQVGLQVRVVASYVDGDGTAESVASAPTSPVANLNTSPTGTVSIDGSAAEDQVLTAVSTLADTDGLGAITYNWQISSGPDWFDVGTGSTLTLSDGHVGHQIRVVASYVDGGGTPESVTSTPTPAVSNGNEAPTFTLGDGVVLVSGFSGRSVALLPDGRIVAGSSVVARLNLDGSLDTSFDGDGMASVGLSGSVVVVQGDGKVVAAGSTDIGNANDFVLVRFNPNGSLDTTFDTDGRVTTDFGVFLNDTANALALQPDGKLLLAGFTTANFN